MDVKKFDSQTLNTYVDDIIQIIRNAGPITDEELANLKNNIFIQLSKAVVSTIINDNETQNDFLNCIKTAGSIDPINNFLIEKMQGKDAEIFSVLDQFKTDFSNSFQSALKR